MNISRIYWEYLSRPPPPQPAPTGFDVMPNFYRDTAIWVSIFSLLFLLVPYISRSLFPAWYANLDKRKRKEYPSYAVCLYHHACLVPRAWLHIYHDLLISTAQSHAINYAAKEAVLAPFCIAYLVSDTLFFALAEALHGKFEFVIHHVMTIYLVASSVSAPGEITRYIPHLLICDTSNLFFNTAWLLRLYGYRDTAIVRALEYLFVIAYFIARVINLPLMFYALSLQPHFASLGYARFTLLPIVIFQFYWFHKIILIMISKIKGSSSSSTTASIEKKTE
jgi:hypothetical protein